MKLSEILSEARKGAFIKTIKVRDAGKVFANAEGKLDINTTIFQKKFVDANPGDEVVPSFYGKKQTNVSALAKTFRYYKGLEMTVHIGDLHYEGIIEIDE